MNLGGFSSYKPWGLKVSLLFYHYHYFGPVTQFTYFELTCDRFLITTIHRIHVIACCHYL